MLSKEQLEERLNCLFTEEELKNKPHNGKNSYYMESQFVLFYRNPNPTRTTDNPDTD